jgi:lipoate-protein ligase A
MHFLDLTLPTLAENLALDEALLLEAEEGGPELLRLWEWPTHAVVLGAAGKLAEEVDEAACLEDNVPIQRRSSGGGTVLLGGGCLVFSLVLNYKRDPALTEIRSSYCYILGRLCEALAHSASGITCAGTSDLALAGQKVSGNSQQRKRHHLLHHGTLLCGFAIEKIGRYLQLPSRQPDYRRQRSHVDFVRNLPIPAAQIKDRLRTAWRADGPAPSWSADVVQRLVATKYALQEWVRRR